MKTLECGAGTTELNAFAWAGRWTGGGEVARSTDDVWMFAELLP